MEVMMELRKHVLDRTGILDEGKTNVVVSIYKGKGDVMSCDHIEELSCQNMQ